MSFLTLQAIRKRYGATMALDGIDLGVERGSRTAIVGPSGSGKTTLLRIIAGSDTPDSGRLMLGGETLADGASSVPAYRRGIGIVAQDGALFPHLSIAENIGFGLPRRDSGRDARIRELMAMVELDPALLRRRPDQLSGGQQQRVALARALAPRPRLVLLDEPFSALDTALRASTRKAVSDLLSAAGVTTILVTHDQAEALSFADQVAVMRQGKLLQVGSPRELYLRPSDPMVASFLGDAIIIPAEMADGWARCALGIVRVGDQQPVSPAMIMLRPEQIGLMPAEPLTQPATEQDVFARVVETDFGGALCTITLEVERGASTAKIPGEAPATTRFSLPRAPMETPEPGTLMRLIINGPGHILPNAVATTSSLPPIR
ncbi:ABC transporter ATP-binding protein [Kaistia dalseonensis]|uniref:Iron(III) transport system ATP-binding protein n=1 Tax=Kaistia dalseonensis TaxID=410840 RepID=A0ABU0H1V9_9HYPH|nr:ABC transporter ATP-binding protein [Kaistia dalseonensis]MCX5493713.1 ABC transporter ATP-binding protein [Kaistia dalseonensis]MDQ0436277.1 iron(III) transport system ATP-binding protein [Kaistia dalseonensis]